VVVVVLLLLALLVVLVVLAVVVLLPLPLLTPFLPLPHSQELLSKGDKERSAWYTHKDPCCSLPYRT